MIKKIETPKCDKAMSQVRYFDKRNLIADQLSMVRIIFAWHDINISDIVIDHVDLDHLYK